MKCIAFLNPNSGNQDLSKADKVVTTLKRLEYKDLFNDQGRNSYAGTGQLQ